MLGTYTENMNDVRYRDLAEYATMVMLMETMSDLKKQGKKITPAIMQEFRDNWTRDGQPMDFATMKAKPSDFAALLRSTGAATFGSLDNAPTLEAGIAELWVKSREEYDKQAASGNFLHVVTDPVIRKSVLDHAQHVMNKAIFTHKGKSARSLDAGNAVTFYGLKDPTYTFNSSVALGTATEQLTGFAGADVVLPDNPIAQEAKEVAQTNQVIQTTDDDADFGDFGDGRTERLLGWHGGTIETEEGKQEYRGLSHLMGAYLTKADAEMVAKNIDDKELFDAELAHNGVELLKHMRSNGYGFNVKDTDKRNQIEVRMTAGENIGVRVFDTDNNGAFIGRIYDTYNTYNYNVKSSPSEKGSVKFNAQDPIAILDYVTGHNTGKVKKTVGNERSQVTLNGIDSKKSLQIVPIKGRYRALAFSGAPEAKEYIEQAIEDAQHLVGASFDVDGMQALIDSGLDNEDVLVTGPDFQAELEAFYSPDALIREAQERAALQLRHSEEGGLEYLTAVRDGIVGNYEDGFNPSFVIDHMAQTGRGNERDAMMAALKTAGYDMSRISGNDFAVNAMKERLVTFNPETARKLEDLEHPMLVSALTTVEKTLKAGGFTGVNGAKGPLVEIDDQGVIRWEANRRTGSNKADAMYQPLTGEIGQVMVPDENGIIKTQFQGDNNYGIVPGYTGHFAFEGDYDDRMKRFRVKGFDQHLTEQLQAAVTHQMTRPLNPVLGDIPTTLDASRLNGLYHGDVYGKRVDLDFLETSQLDMATKQAILTTLSGRVRFDNQFSDYATTSAETQANREKANGDDAAAFSYWKAAGEVNMRVLDADLTNYADMTMTGTGKTQGLIWFLADGAEINKDGSVTPSKGMLDKEGNMVPDVTALQKLPYFDKKSFNAWDRNQMSSNQLMTALKVDENVNTALMAFGGWTFDDSYAVSKEFADRNKVFGSKPNEHSMDVLDSTIKKLAIDPKQDSATLLKGSHMVWSEETLNKGVELFHTWSETKNSVGRLQAGEQMEVFLEEHGRFRPLQRGDKLSDFGGNKGTIGIVIDRDMDPAVAKKEGLEKEVAFMKENNQLDVISAPYSMLSRHNAGVVKELMDGEVQDLRDPETGEVFKGAMGKLNIIVTDMVVDDKTHAYSREDVLDGKGRKASGQLAWALQSKDAAGILNEIYGRNDSAWSTYREYLIATGLDMKPDGTIVSGYTPHAGEDRNHFAHEPDTDSSSFLEKIKDQGGFLDVPFELKFKNDQVSSEIPVLSASLRQNVELIDGSMRVSNFTNYYANLYDAVGEYNTADTDADREKSRMAAQVEFDKIQSTIIERQFDGGHNGKHSFIRDKIMGKRMSHSATGVAIVDPRLNIGEAGMNQEMMDALDAKEGDMVMAFRDPVWRDGAIRAMKVVKDDSVHGIAINPIADKSHDMDFDGDTMGIMKFDTKEANADLVNKFSHWANMIDHGSGKDELYFQSGMDLASAQAKAEKAGDMSPRELFEKAHKNALTDSPKLHKQACRDLNTYSHKLFREHGFGGDFVSFTSDETVFNSFGQMVDNGAKGSPKKLEDYKNYHTGKKTPQDGRDIQYASGVKSDDTGLAGAFSQKLVAVMRNQNITAALESMYPLTQGTLQIKHDAEHAKVVNEILTDDMNKTFRGKDSKNSKKKLTPNGFKAQLTDIMENKMKVDVNEEFIDAVTETLTYKGQIIPLSDAMQLKGSPMDRVAYGGGYEELKRLGRSNESLLTGKQNELFAPFTMRNATADTKLAKRDTQRIIETPVLAPTAGSAPKSSDAVIATEKQVETEDAGLAI